MNVAWPDSLISDIARRRIVILLGSGISRQSTNADGKHPPMWVECLQAAIDATTASASHKACIEKLIRGRDLLTACEAVKEAMGDADFRRFMRGQYLDPKFNHAPIHDSIIALDSQITATPNFDKIFDTRINAVQSGSVAVKTYDDNDLADVIRGTSRVIIKVHGTIDRAAGMIFTRTEYAKARNQHRAFYAILEALAITHTFLFLGCGIEDPDIKLLLEDYAFTHAFSRPHYFVLPKSHVPRQFKTIYEKSLNIKILEYSPENSHVNLVQSIDCLVQSVNSARIQIGNTFQW